MDNILEIKHLNKKFGEIKAVDDVSFNLGQGEILGLLGPNGAGKTTIIQMLLGVLLPSSGNISYFGKNLKSHREEILEQVNFSTTYTNLPWDLTVKEVMAYTSYLYKIENRKDRILRIKELFKLSKIWNQKMAELSAGQLTRVNLAKAFLNFPKVLLLDEPTASLDPEVANYIRNFLIGERKNFNVSILITSHNMAEVQELCDRVIFLKEGKILADDTPEKLAESIKVVHVEFLIRGEFEKTALLCQKEKVPFKTRGKYTTVDLEESKIDNFLECMKKNGIAYDEISIRKPTLEDYFLQVAAI